MLLLPHAASDSVSAAAQKRESIFLPFIKNDLLRHYVCQMRLRSCWNFFFRFPWNEVIIARQPKGKLKESLNILFSDKRKKAVPPEIMRHCSYLYVVPVGAAQAVSFL